MFEVGFSEVLVIVVVALVVIGPEKLPKLARTYGLLYGKAQRYFSGIKQDLDRDLALENMRKATAEAQQKILSFQSQFTQIESEAEALIEKKPIVDKVSSSTEVVS